MLHMAGKMEDTWRGKSEAWKKQKNNQPQQNPDMQILRKTEKLTVNVHGFPKRI